MLDPTLEVNEVPRGIVTVVVLEAADGVTAILILAVADLKERGV